MHKKIHVVEMAGGRTMQKGFEGRQENQRHRANTEAAPKLTATKDRFREMEAMAKEVSAET